ncbi:GerAB/ArcD/ProY family transporter [Anaerobacillus sp. MEB173]|uniref:GerAB/ArcD/ProY family transporter n=1 Tax=Anaerobacillus sp. MEB173 TaxID=3383345 RepID=UPI003F8DD4D6
MDAKRQFRSMDLFAFTIATTITLGVTFLPFVSEEEIRNVWLKLLVASFPYFFLFALLYFFTKKYSDYDLFGAVKQHVWAWFYWLIILYYIGSTLVSGIHFSESLVMITQTYLLFNTHRWVILLTFFLVVAFGVNYGITTITRFIVSLVFFELFVLVVVIFIGFTNYFKWIYIPPLWPTDIVTFLESTYTDLARYAGVIPLFAFLSFMKRDEPILLPMSIGLGIVTMIYVLLSIVVVGTFGFEQSIHLLSPVTALVQAMATRTGVFERLDLFFLVFWLISYYKMMIIHIWFITYLGNRLWPKVKPIALICVYLLAIFVMTMFSDYFVYKGWDYHNTNVLINSLVIPIALILYLLYKKRNNEVNHHA